jgi:hypothetical protein
MPLYEKKEGKTRKNNCKPPSWDLTSPETVAFVTVNDTKNKVKEQKKVVKREFEKNALKEAKQMVKAEKQQAKQQVKRKLNYK